MWFPPFYFCIKKKERKRYIFTFSLGNTESNKQAAVKVKKPVEEPRAASPPPPSVKEEKMVEDPSPADPEPVPAQASSLPPPAPTPSSFAPQGFVFQAPAGLSNFKPTPLTPRSADSFFKPR